MFISIAAVSNFTTIRLTEVVSKLPRQPVCFPACQSVFMEQLRYHWTEFHQLTNSTMIHKHLGKTQV
jgi:hypothetical protein